MIVACGPFTCSDNLEYEPLLVLLSTLGSEQCSLVLCGPFLDCEHPHLKAELCPGSSILGSNYTYQEAFERIMQLVLSRVPNCDLVIVPSTRDLTHLLPMPQAPFQCSPVAIFAQNPCYISANDYRICISTADIVKEICTGSCFRASHPVSRIKQAFNELLEQRSLHPFCPTATQWISNS